MQVKVARMIFNSIPPVPSVEAISQGPWNEQAIFDVMSRFGLQRYLEEGRVIPDALSANYYNDESTNF
jgi:flap endonuclease-1